MYNRDRNIPSDDEAEGSIDRLKGWPLADTANEDYKRGFLGVDTKKGRKAKVRVQINNGG